MRIREGSIERRRPVFDPTGSAQPDPPIGLERWINFLNRPEITEGKPLFDRGRFVTSPSATLSASADENALDLTELIKASGPSGGLLSAAWEGGNRRNPSPKVTKAAKSYKELVEARDYWDMRQHGKIRCGPDITYAQAAKLEADERLQKKLDKTRRLYWAEKCLLYHLRLPRTWLEFRYLGWLLAAVLRFAFELERRDSDRQRSYGYHAIVGGKSKPGKPAFLSERELLSKEAIAASKERNARTPKRQRAVFLDAREELELARRAKAGDIVAANKIILAHLPIAKRIAKQYAAKHGTDDLIQEGVFGLKKALDAFDPERGFRFSDLVEQAVDWAIKDYVKKQRRHYALSLDAPIGDTDTTFKDILVDPNSLEIEPAQPPTLDCLNDRERYIIEARLDGRTRAVIGAELGISDERVRQIEARAVAKLKKLASHVVQRREP